MSMKIFKNVLLLIGNILAVLVLMFMVYIIWENVFGLQKAVEVVRGQFTVGDDAFRFHVPKDRTVLVSIDADAANGKTKCLSLTLSHEIVRYFNVEGVTGSKLSISDGAVDLMNYRGQLERCNRISILLMSKAGYMKGNLDIYYAKGKVTEIGEVSSFD